MSSAGSEPTFLVTRAEPEASRFTDELRGRGLNVLGAPLTEHQGVGSAVDQGDAEALLVTSPRGLLLAQDLPDLPVHAVGERSAETARGVGLTVASTGPGAAEDAFLRAIPAGTRLLHLSGETLSRDLEGPLSSAGVHYRRQVVYRTVPVKAAPPALKAFAAANGPRYVTFLSVGAVEAYKTLAKPCTKPRPAALCLSQRVADAARAAKLFSETCSPGEPSPLPFVDFIAARRT